MKTQPTRTSGRPGVGLGWLLAGAALAGAIGGVVLFFGKSRDPGEQLDEAEVAAAQALPLGEPVATEDPMAPDPQSLRGIPAYPNASPRKLMNRPAVQGVPMAVSWFQTFDSPDAVLSFYEKQFADANIEAVSHRYNERLGYVAWLERQGGFDAGAAHGIMHMVTASKEGSKTVVLVSASRPDLLMEAQPPLPEGLPLPPATETPQVIQMAEGPGTRQVVYTRTLNTPTADVVTFFRAELKKAGWALVDEADGDEQRSVVARRSGSTVVVNAQADGVDSNLIITFTRQSAVEAIQ